ncbi:unnamed protein product [Cyprideis torosa]|uniref:Uncharacterized protein n=1 Tax=Cyprideis torosa TaxID=163714 RepID=A0A7R8WKP2_9CRUS|nr:unnamed protein product [Cyprideis torosa]CAG0896333.1 unnamed protein product [Cyprideis torosa]
MGATNEERATLDHRTPTCAEVFWHFLRHPLRTIKEKRDGWARHRIRQRWQRRSGRWVRESRRIDQGLRRAQEMEELRIQKAEAEEAAAEADESGKEQSDLTLLATEQLASRLAENQRLRDANTDPEVAKILEDERLALFLQNEEFMAELRQNREFMEALEKDIGAPLGGVSSTKSVPSEELEIFRDRLKNMGKSSRKKFLQLARRFNISKKKGAKYAAQGDHHLTSDRLVESDDDSHGEHSDHEDGGHPDISGGDLTLLATEQLASRLAENQRLRDANTDPEVAKILEDERLALFLQNEEFMAELRQNREFMEALEKDIGAPLGGVSSTKSVPSEELEIFRDRLKNMGKSSRKKFLQLARRFNISKKKGAKYAAQGDHHLTSDRLVESDDDSHGEHSDHEDGGHPDISGGDWRVPLEQLQAAVEDFSRDVLAEGDPNLSNSK